MTSDTGFDDIDRQIENLLEHQERCRKAMLASKLAMLGAFATLAIVLTVAGGWRTPPVVFGAIAAMIGGLVWLGASKSSNDEIADELATLDAHKSEMIDRVAERNGWRDMTPTVH